MAKVSYANPPMTITSPPTLAKAKYKDAMKYVEEQLARSDLPDHVKAEVATVQTSEQESRDPLGERRSKRSERDRPWRDNAPLIPPSTKDTKIQVHYETYLPKDKWLQMKPMMYSHNPKWGQAYMTKTVKGKPFKPETEQWLYANDFRIWMLEKGENGGSGNGEGQDSLMPLDMGPGPAMGNSRRPDMFGKGNDRHQMRKTSVMSNGSDRLMPLHGGGADFGGKRNSRRMSKRGSIMHGNNPGQGGAFANIGPHADLYEQYRAVELQREQAKRYQKIAGRFVRGWIVRSKLRKLRKRVLINHASTWEKFIREYKGLITRIQKRYGAKLPSAPFNMEECKDFINRKERYEKVFEELQVANKLPRSHLKNFFEDCGLTPSDKEVNLAFQAVYRGCGAKAEVVFVCDCSSSLGDDNYRIQVDFVTEVIHHLHIGAENVRMGYVPYNTDVFEWFALDTYHTREDLTVGIEKVKYRKGITRTDLALKKMREIFKAARADVAKVGILITDGGSYASYATEKQAELCRKENIDVYCVGVGKGVERRELFSVATDKEHVYFVENYHKLSKIRAQLMQKACFINCKYCQLLAPDELKEEQSKRGLYKEEVMEILWMIYPPLATGYDPVRRSQWMRIPRREGQNGLSLMEEDNDDSEFNTCLKFVIKSKLEKDGIVLKPAEDGGVTEVSRWEDSLNVIPEAKDTKGSSAARSKKKGLKKK